MIIHPQFMASETKLFSGGAPAVEGVASGQAETRLEPPAREETRWVEIFLPAYKSGMG